MAARSGASEGINLISSIYSDDDDDDDDMENIEHQETPNDDVNTTAMENDTRNTNSEERGVDFVEEDTPPLSSDRSRPLTPQQSQQQPQISLPSPPLQPPSRSRLHRLTIVDYGHDEVTLSPEAEDGEIVGAGVVMIGTQLQTTNGIQEKTPPGTAQVLSPSNKTDPQLSQQPDASESHTMNYAVNVSESTGIEEAVTVSMEASTDIDPFDGFLPPPPMAGCSDELQERINKFLYLKRLGKSYNAEVRKKKEYRNPDFLLHAVTYQDIDEIGSCFIKDVFDPHGYDKSDYCYEIEANMKRELERKEQEKKKSQKVEFVTGGTQPLVVAPRPKINFPIPGVSTVATGGLHPVPASVDSVARDVRQNKKSKWDKVDGDRRNPLHSGGKDSVSTASAHAALLTAANAGTGYTAFALFVLGIPYFVVDWNSGIIIFYAMAVERDDSLQAISTRLDGNNYSYWSYVMKNFLKGKKMWGYVMGTTSKPTDLDDKDFVEKLEVWDVNNSKIITWINNSVEHSIGTQLAKYETAKKIWDHLKRLYTQSNFAKQYQLESDIRALVQNTMGIQEFYLAMSNLWDQLSLTESAELQGFAPYITRREEQRLVQFLMALRDDFEGLRGSILHRNPLPSVDSVVSELLAEEIRLKSQSSNKGILPAPNPSVFAVPSRPPSSSPSRPKVGFDECSFCKRKGHWKAQCPMLLNRAQNLPQQRSSGNQSQQRAYRPPQSNTAATVPPSPLSGFGAPPSSNPTMAALAEQFQQFLHNQPSAMSASSSFGLSSSGSSGAGLANPEADWDRL